MPTFLYYFNGEFSDQPPVISVYDAGFVQGLTVSEQLRTFRGRLYRLDDHLRRMQRSLEIVGVDLPISWDELASVVVQIASKNYTRLAPHDDLGVTVLVTPGTYHGMVAPQVTGPTVCVHAQPLAFEFWCEKYSNGQRLVTSSIRQTSPLNWPPELKCRSRMHYYLADQEAQRIDPAARALLLDLDGFVSESSTANILVYSARDGFIVPHQAKVLPGISLAVVHELAQEMNYAWHERDLTPPEFMAAAEIMLCSTSPCLLPVVSVDGQRIGTGGPGVVFQQLISAWSAKVGLDIAEQARLFAQRAECFVKP